jgi:hypothetical protein
LESPQWLITAPPKNLLKTAHNEARTSQIESISREIDEACLTRESWETLYARYLDAYTKYLDGILNGPNRELTVEEYGDGIKELLPPMGLIVLLEEGVEHKYLSKVQSTNRLNYIVRMTKGVAVKKWDTDRVWWIENLL